MKGFKGEPGEIIEQKLEKLESKKFDLNCIRASIYF